MATKQSTVDFILKQFMFVPNVSTRNWFAELIRITTDNLPLFAM